MLFDVGFPYIWLTVFGEEAEEDDYDWDENKDK